MALQAMPRGQSSSTIAGILSKMPVADRDNMKKLKADIRKAGWKEPSSQTLYKGREEYKNSSNGKLEITTPTGLADDLVSIHDLAELMSQKDLIQRIGIQKIEKIFKELNI